MKNILQIVLVIASAALVQGCGDDSKSVSTAIDGNYGLTGASCNDSAATISKSSVLKAATNEPLTTLKVEKGRLKFIQSLTSTCTITMEFKIKKDSGTTLIVNGGSISATGDESCKVAAQQVKSSLSSNDRSTSYKYTAPVLTLTNPNTGSCMVFKNLSSSTGTTGDASTKAVIDNASLKNWFGRYGIGYSYDYCSHITGEDLDQNWRSTDIIDFVELSASALKLEMRSYSPNTCYATVTIPVVGQEASKLLYGAPTVTLTSGYASDCKDFTDGLKARAIYGLYSKFYADSEGLEITDPVDGDCMKFTKSSRP